MDTCVTCQCCELAFTDIGKARYERGWKSLEGVAPLDGFLPEEDEQFLEEFAPKEK